MPEAGKSDFGGEYDANTHRAHLSAYVLIAGLCLEFVHAIVWFHGLETVVTMVAVLMIVAGVWGEVFFGNKARIAGDKQLAQYEARAAEANAKALEAQLELARLRTPRRQILRDKEKGPQVTEAVKAFAGTVFDTGSGPMDEDVGDCLWDLEPLLWAAGWRQIDWTNPTLMPSGITRGAWPDRRMIGNGLAVSNVSIHIHPDSEAALGPAADALVAALNKIGLAAKRDPFNIHNANTEAMHILVGPIR